MMNCKRGLGEINRVLIPKKEEIIVLSGETGSRSRHSQRIAINGRAHHNYKKKRGVVSSTLKGENPRLLKEIVPPRGLERFGALKREMSEGGGERPSVRRTGGGGNREMVGGSSKRKENLVVYPAAQVLREALGSKKKKKIIKSNEPGRPALREEAERGFCGSSQITW